jgi:hypothetical protein
MTPSFPASRPSRPVILASFWSWFLRRSRPHPAPPEGRHPAILVFEASDPAFCALSLRIAGNLSAQGYSIERIGYFPDRAEHPEADFSHFNNKALAWSGCPRGAMIDALHSRSWSLAIGLHGGSCPPIQWLIQQLPARLRIGPAAGEAIYHLVLDGHQENPEGFAEHLDRLLQTLQDKVHVHS